MLKLNLSFSGSTALRLGFAVASISILFCSAARGQSFDPSTTPDAPVPLSQPGAANSSAPNSFRTTPHPGADHQHAESDDRRGPKGPGEDDSKTFSWNRFLTSAAQTGVRFAVPRYTTQGFGAAPGGSFMGSGNSFSGSGTATSGMAGAGTSSFRAGGSAMDLGSGLLRSLADSTGGSLGTTLHAVSGLTDSRTGFAVPLPTSSVNFRLSGSLGNLLGPAGMMSGGGGMQGSGMQTGGMQGNGMNSFGGAGMGGGHSPGGAGGSKGPSLSLSLKF